VTLRRGANTQTVSLKIEGFQEQVLVDEASGSQASGSAETTKVLDESIIDQLPEDPDELQAMLEQMAGGVGRSSASTALRAAGCRIARTSGRSGSDQLVRGRQPRRGTRPDRDHHAPERAGVERQRQRELPQRRAECARRIRRHEAAAERRAYRRGHQGTARRAEDVAAAECRPQRDEQRANIFALNPDGSPFLGFVSNPTHNTFGTVGLEHALTDMQTLRVEYQRQQNVSRTAASAASTCRNGK